MSPPDKTIHLNMSDIMNSSTTSCTPLFFSSQVQQHRTEPFLTQPTECTEDSEVNKPISTQTIPPANSEFSPLSHFQIGSNFVSTNEITAGTSSLDGKSNNKTMFPLHEQNLKLPANGHSLQDRSQKSFPPVESSNDSFTDQLLNQIQQPKPSLNGSAGNVRQNLGKRENDLVSSNSKAFPLAPVQHNPNSFSSYKTTSTFTPINPTRTNPFTPAKKQQIIFGSTNPHSIGFFPSRQGLFNSVQTKITKSNNPRSSTTLHKNKNVINSSSFMFSPLSKPPSELVSFDLGRTTNSPKTQGRNTCDKDEDETHSVDTPPSTPFRFSSFPASLPRVHPRPVKSITISDDIISNAHKQGDDEMNKIRIEGTDLFSSPPIEQTPNYTSTSNSKPCSEKEVKRLGIPLPRRKHLEEMQPYVSPKVLSGRYRSLDTSHDTSISSISVSSPMSPRYDGRMPQRTMSPLLSQGSESGMSLSDSMEIEKCLNEDFELMSPEDSNHGARKVSGTKLNFNSVSPGIEMKNEAALSMNAMQDDTTPVHSGKAILRHTHSNDLTETYEPNYTESFPSLFLNNLPISSDKNILDQTDTIDTPFRISNKRLDYSSSTRHDEFQCHLESTQCSPIHCMEDSCSSTSPTNLILDKEQNENEDNFLSGQDLNTSGISVSSTSSKIRKLRPMPDMSAFEVGRPGQRRSSWSANNRSSISGAGTSPIHPLCPPTPVRTPAWAHNDTISPSFSGQDSLISSKILAACSSDLFEGSSSFENSLGDEQTHASSLDQTPATLNQNRYRSQSEEWTLTSIQEDNDKLVKGRRDRVSTGSMQPSLASNYPPSTVKKPNVKSLFRRDPSLSRSGEVGSVISFEADFENLGQLGKGHFADVYKARSRIDNTLYAIKRNRRQFRGKRDRENALAEVRIMQRLQVTGKRSSDEKVKGYCPYLLQFIRAWQEDGYFFCQTEICCRDNLRSMMMSLSTDWHIAIKRYPSLLLNVPSHADSEDIDFNGRLFPEQAIWKICHNVVAGLSHIHEHNIIHNDIKPSNIFFSSHPRLGCICKIGDFGLAVDFDSAEDGHEGDTKYMPKELLSSNKKHPSADIFSLGLTLYELTANFSFVLPSEGPKWHSIRSGENLSEIPSSRSKDLPTLIQNMIHPDPSKRPSATAILHEVPKVKKSESLNDKFLTDYVQDVDDYDRAREREIAAMQKEASLSRSTPTAGGLLRVDTQHSDRSWNLRTPTAEVTSYFFDRTPR